MINALEFAEVRQRPHYALAAPRHARAHGRQWLHVDTVAASRIRRQ